MRRILFVCTGNTCRSPLAQALLQSKASEIEVKSAGVYASPGDLASEGVRKILAEKEIELDHQSTKVNEQLMEWADLVLTLTTSHKSLILQTFPQYIDKVFTLKEYVYNNETIEKTNQMLQHHYSLVEIKRAKFIAEHKETIEQCKSHSNTKELDKLTEQFQELLKPDLEKIKELEEEVPSFDIQDPFGGSLEVYRQTSKEIEQAIDKLIKKLAKKS
ncbi:MAG: low molecular weight protein arginine phosphatase [Bacillaceae bacterium]|nr:low molecular weight protein arginine phosphatase [Bacillaceae bacterium]